MGNTEKYSKPRNKTNKTFTSLFLEYNKDELKRIMFIEGI